MQAVALPKPKEPTAQLWHTVEVPSTKYWPTPQHKAAPVGVQWPYVLEQDGEHEVGILE